MRLPPGRLRRLPPFSPPLPPPGSSAARALLEQVRVGESWFFREVAPLVAWRDRVLRGAAPGRRLRALSMGCSAGEEVYSLAMLLAERETGGRVEEIVGVDISHAALQEASGARYAPDRLRALTPDRRSRFFEVEGGTYAVKRSLREQTRFLQGNLSADLDGLGTFDLLLCRNVVIYFDTTSRLAAARRLARLLRPGGLLIVGAAETLLSWDPFVPLALDGLRLHALPTGSQREDRVSPGPAPDST